MPSRFSPQRRCVSCRELRSKLELWRLVRTPERLVVLDLPGKVQGRGAYVCRQAACVRRALKGRLFDKSLHQSLPEALAKDLAALGEEYATGRG
ncbi:MAG TPA: YlxR family protein [Chroococcales cyanobacterium]